MYLKLKLDSSNIQCGSLFSIQWVNKLVLKSEPADVSKTAGGLLNCVKPDHTPHPGTSGSGSTW